MVQRRNPHPPPRMVYGGYTPPPPPVGLWCWVVVLPGSVGLFACVLLVGVLCTPPPPLWPCGGPAVLAIKIYMVYIYIYRIYDICYIYLCVMMCNHGLCSFEAFRVVVSQPGIGFAAWAHACAESARA